MSGSLQAQRRKLASARARCDAYETETADLKHRAERSARADAMRRGLSPDDVAVEAAEARLAVESARSQGALRLRWRLRTQERDLAQWKPAPKKPRADPGSFSSLVAKACRA